MNYTGKRKKKSIDSTEKLDELMEELELFQEWKKNVPEELRNFLMTKRSAKDISKAFASHAAARLALIALTETDSGKAMAACKDLLDRSEGKAVETQKIEHKYNNLDDHQLNALLQSALDSGEVKVVNIDELEGMISGNEDDEDTGLQ